MKNWKVASWMKWLSLAGTGDGCVLSCPVNSKKGVEFQDSVEVGLCVPVLFCRPERGDGLCPSHSTVCCILVCFKYNFNSTTFYTVSQTGPDNFRSLGILAVVRNEKYSGNVRFYSVACPWQITWYILWFHSRVDSSGLFLSFVTSHSSSSGGGAVDSAVILGTLQPT
jgi:hypothetical protein